MLRICFTSAKLEQSKSEPGGALNKWSNSSFALKLYFRNNAVGGAEGRESRLPATGSVYSSSGGDTVCVYLYVYVMRFYILNMFFIEITYSIRIEALLFDSGPENTHIGQTQYNRKNSRSRCAFGCFLSQQLSSQSVFLPGSGKALLSSMALPSKHVHIS